MDQPKPYPKNVPGDFYIEDQCCTACGVMHDEAGDLLGWDDLHCFVKRQPVSESDIFNVLNAMAVAEFDCVRYAGADKRIAQRIVDIGSAHCLDTPLNAERRFRDHVTFAATLQSRPEILNALLAEVQQTDHLTGRARENTLIFSWGYGEHSLRIDGSRDGRWLAKLAPAGMQAATGAARTAHNLFTTAGCFSDLRWRTAADYAARGDDWLPTPY